MSDKDKLKELLDKNLKREFQKPTNEWTEIVEKIEVKEKNYSWLKLPMVAMGTLAMIALLAVVFRPSDPLSSPSESQRVEISEFLIQSQEIIDADEESDEYTYLALIE